MKKQSTPIAEGHDPSGALLESSDERRREDRQMVNIWVTEQLGGGESFFHPARDLSAGGIFLEKPFPFATGTQLNLEIDLGDGKEPLHVEGEVIRTETGDESGMAVRFTNLTSQDQERIRAYLQGI
jgi:hypothetical protein